MYSQKWYQSIKKKDHDENGANTKVFHPGLPFLLIAPTVLIITGNVWIMDYLPYYQQ